MSSSFATLGHAQSSTTRLVPARARLVVAGAMLAAAAAGFAMTSHPVTVDPALARLLRAMALIKLCIAAGAGAALYWRLASPVGPFRLGAYTAAAGCMAAGPGLIWNLGHIAAGAALLHGGLLVTVLLLWRDPATGERLEAVIVRRRSKPLLF